MVTFKLKARANLYHLHLCSIFRIINLGVSDFYGTKKIDLFDIKNWLYQFVSPEIRKKQPDAMRDSSSNRHSLPLGATLIAKPPSGSPRTSVAAAPTPHSSDSRTALAVLNSLRNIRRGNSVENLSASSPQDKSKSDSQKSNGSLKRLKTEREMVKD